MTGTVLGMTVTALSMRPVNGFGALACFAKIMSEALGGQEFVVPSHGSEMGSFPGKKFFVAGWGGSV